MPADSQGAALQDVKGRNMTIEWIASGRNKQGISKYFGDGRFVISVTRSAKGRAVGYSLSDNCNRKVGEYTSSLRHHKSLADAKACAEELLVGKHLAADQMPRVDLMKAIFKLPEDQREIASKLVDYIDHMFNDSDNRSSEQYDELDSRIDRLRRNLRDI